MNARLRSTLTALSLALALPAGAAEKSDFAILHALGQVEDNRIVGLWDARVDVGACTGAGPRRQFRGLNVFNLGGTLVYTNAFGPTTRGPGFGTWVRDRRSGKYESRMQFYRYLPDGSFDGVQDITRETTMSADGNRTEDVVYVRVLNPDDSLRLEMCGTAVATRVGIE
jgi:hypothetical protein